MNKTKIILAAIGGVIDFSGVSVTKGSATFELSGGSSVRLAELSGAKVVASLSGAVPQLSVAGNLALTSGSSVTLAPTAAWASAEPLIKANDVHWNEEVTLAVDVSNLGGGLQPVRIPLAQATTTFVASATPTVTLTGTDADKFHSPRLEFENGGKNLYLVLSRKPGLVIYFDAGNSGVGQN